MKIWSNNMKSMIQVKDKENQILIIFSLIERDDLYLYNIIWYLYKLINIVLNIRISTNHRKYKMIKYLTKMEM